MLVVLQRLGCIRIEPLTILIQQKFSITSRSAAERVVHAALQQLWHCCSNLRTEQDIVYFSSCGIKQDHLDAINVMLELVGDSLFDFATETPPILLRFVVEHPKPTAFVVVNNSRSGLPPTFFPAEKSSSCSTKANNPRPFPSETHRSSQLNRRTVYTVS